MKINKKTSLYLAVLAIGIALILISQANKLGKKNEVSTSPNTNVSPTPFLKVEVVKSYKDWVDELAPDYRHIVLDSTCSTIVPSNVTYKNNTQVMLDNTASAKPRDLKVGDRTYNLVAHGWFLTNLYSPKLPAHLPIFCGNIELGAIDLE